MSLPEEIPHRLIKLLSYVGETVLDPFMGSGTTGVAAKKLKRRYLGVDNDVEAVKHATARIAGTV